MRLYGVDEKGNPSRGRWIAFIIAEAIGLIVLIWGLVFAETFPNWGLFGLPWMLWGAPLTFLMDQMTGEI